MMVSKYLWRQRACNKLLHECNQKVGKIEVHEMSCFHFDDKPALSVQCFATTCSKTCILLWLRT